MFKILLKKQMIELATPFIMDRKTGKRKTGKKMIGYIILFVYIFAMLAFNGVNNAKNIISVFDGWMYFALMFCLSSALGIMIAIIITFSGIFMAKDNDLLLSMPIPVHSIIISRMMNSYIWAFVWTAPGIIPTTVVYLVEKGFSIGVLFSGLISIFLAPLVAADLAILVAWIIGQTTKKVVNKNTVFVIMTIVFCGGYGFLNSLIMQTVTTLSAAEVQESYRGLLAVLKVFGTGISGNILNLLIVLAVSAAMTLLFFFILSSSFLNIVTTKVAGKKKQYSDNMIVSNSPNKALLKREFTHFLKSPIYLINTSMGTFFTLIGAVALLIAGKKLKMALGLAGVDQTTINMVAVTILMGLCSMNFISSPSFTLEGKSLWIVKSMPVDYQTIIDSKVAVHFYVTAVPAILAFLAGLIFLPLDARILIAVITFSYTCGVLGLLMDLKHGSTQFINETAAVKQNPIVILSMCINLGMCAVCCVPYFLLKNKINIDGNGWINYVFVLCLTAAVFSKRTLKSKGVLMFEEAE